MSNYVSKNGKVAISFSYDMVIFYYNFRKIGSKVTFVENNVISNLLDSLLLFKEFHIDKSNLSYGYDRFKMVVYLNEGYIRMMNYTPLKLDEAINLLLSKLYE